MRLDTEFIRLPFRVDAARLAQEIAVIPESAWRPHPQGFPGNSALALVAAHGDPNNDAVAGPMLATPHLAAFAYLQQVLSALSTVIGRTRLMRLDGNAEATPHTDTHYYWFERARVHIPILTHPDVTFHCGEQALHMAEGEVWIFDTWSPHRVVNPRPTRRIHLVADTVGSADFWALVDAGDHVFAPERSSPAPDREIAFDPLAVATLRCETWNVPRVMSPAQVDAVIAQVRSSLPSDPYTLQLESLLRTFSREWRGLWAHYGDAAEHVPVYAAVCERLGAALDALGDSPVLVCACSARQALRSLLVNPHLSEHKHAAPSRPRLAPAPPAPTPRQCIERPIFIVSPPRSGSTLLFETLAKSPDLWTIGGESHLAFEGIGALHPRARDYASNQLTADDATPAVVAQLKAAFLRQLRERDGLPPPLDGPLRLLEKTPKNALRVPFLARAFPDACFVYLYRDPRETMSSMLDAWRSEKFVTYELPDWQGPRWSLLLTPGWRELGSAQLSTIVAEQWATSTRVLLDDLEALPAEAWCIASYDRLLADPRAEIERLCKFVGARWDRPLVAPLPLSRTTLTSPDPEKWRRNASELESMLPRVREVAERARQVFATPPATRPALPIPRNPQAAQQRVTPDFNSVYTKSFAQLLHRMQATLVVTTYQSGRLILVRARGDTLNTHLRAFPSPMGIAVARGRLALGTKHEVWEFFDMPALSSTVDPESKPDSVYVPRTCAVTGDIRVHELAYAGDTLWVTNTRFSTLCTLDQTHSFVPRWRPPFISELTPEDRCHLNGLCVVNDRVRFVSMFGQTNTAGGWRENKRAGGCILEVPSGQPVVSGLCMPHSPRWHEDALWVLESGKGQIGRADLDARTVRPCAELNGFTRGLAFAGPYAFVGLSQVREANVFGDIPLVDRVKERTCGVWIVDVRDGKTVGCLRFEGSVQEIFDVKLLPHSRFADLLEPNSEHLGGAFALPQEALAEIPAQWQTAQTAQTPAADGGAANG